MGRWGKQTLLLSALALLALALAGCGSSSSTTGGESGESTAQQAPHAEQTAQLGRSSEFLGPKKENKQAKFGKEGSASELEEVSETVEASLSARGEGDWAGQCATLSKTITNYLASVPAGKQLKGCPAQLGALGEKASPAVLKNNIAGGIAAFRMSGDKGYALYHGTDKKDWSMPMEKEGDEWKVAALLAEELPR